MYRFGLKLWSNNKNYVKEAVRLFEQGTYHYIEMYIIPDITKSQVSMWKSLDIPYVIHAPHFGDGLNLAKRENKEKNRLLIKKAQEVADLLKADKIIVHPGIEGDIKETVEQLREINEPRIIIENKPYYALYDGLICTGATIEEIKYVLDNVEVGFCLDIGHAFCAATAKKIEPLEYVKQFIKLSPKMYHLTDGDYTSVYDKHDHIGKGNYDMYEILKLIEQRIRITVETVKDSKESLSDFEQDILSLERILEDEYQFKLASGDDVMEVFGLSNDPVVRENSFSQAPILLEEHMKWYKNKITSPDCIFYIIIDRVGELMGYARFDKNSQADVFVITVHLAAKYRGKGLGSKIIKKSTCMALKEKGCAGVVAYIKENNLISMRSFLKAGYKLAGNEIINNKPCYKMSFRSEYRGKYL